MPTLVDVDVTADHVSKVANFLSGSTGVSGLDAAQWQNLLLKHSGARERLREAMASLTQRLSTRAMKAKKLMALDKCPGIRPIGVGDAADRLCAKIIIEITGEDVQFKFS